MNELEKLTKAVRIIELINQERMREKSLRVYYDNQLDMHLTKSFLFRSKNETERQIEFYKSVCLRLWKYYTSTIQTLTPNL